MRKMRLFYVCFVLFSAVLSAQKNIKTQELMWIRYKLKVVLDDKHQISQELEERFFLTPWKQSQMLSRTQLEKKLENGWGTTAGFALFLHTKSGNATYENEYVKPELRPHISFGYSQDLTHTISLKHRYQSEFRFSKTEAGSFEYSNNRSRYKLELKYQPTSAVSLAVFDEILLNIGKNVVQNVFDTNRYGIGFQYSPLANLGVELGYFNSFQQQKNGVDFLNQNIVRMTIHHTLDFSKVN